LEWSIHILLITKESHHLSNIRMSTLMFRETAENYFSQVTSAISLWIVRDTCNLRVHWKTRARGGRLYQCQSSFLQILSHARSVSKAALESVVIFFMGHLARYHIDKWNGYNCYECPHAHRYAHEIVSCTLISLVLSFLLRVTCTWRSMQRDLYLYFILYYILLYLLFY